MPESTLADVMDALAAQLQDELAGTVPEIDDLQVVSRLIFNPTPPAIDIYPNEEFMEQISFGSGNVAVFFTVRARVTTADHPAGQDLLLSMMDSRSATSVVQALGQDTTLNGTVDDVLAEPPSNYGLFVDPGQATGLLGCTWRVGVIL